MNKHFSNFLIIFCFQYLIFNQSVYSQNYCGADSLHQALLNTDKAYKAKTDQFEALWQNHLYSQYKKELPDSIPRVITVIFHIIHDNGPENIPDSLIYQQIDILNEDFRKLPGAPGDGNGVDSKIEFCLASFDESGNPATGITRTSSPCTDYTQLGCPEWPGSIIVWDPSRYLNIWVRKNLGHLGFGGPTWNVEVRYDCVGRNSIRNGRVVTHEIGHWAYLLHTFEGGCQTGNCNTTGDKLCDTPPVSSPNDGCPVSVNSCTTDIPDQADLVKNYMDYGSCPNMFTQGQKERMHSFMDWYHYGLYTDSNLQATGCHPCNPGPCVPYADFKADKVIAGLEDPITFTDLSFNIPTSRQWSFPGGSPSSSNAQNPVIIYSAAGTYTVSLTVSNGAGSGTVTKTSYIVVTNLKWDSLITGTDLINTDAWPPAHVQSLEVYKDELYVAGFFNIAGGDTVNYIAKWNGMNWSGLGAGLGYDTSVYGQIYLPALCVFNNELYAGGNLNSAGQIVSPALAKWDGTEWYAVNTGFLNNIFFVYDMIVLNNKLYITFQDTIDYQSRILEWDGVNGVIIGTADKKNKTIKTMGVYKNQLIAGGVFGEINGVALNHIGKYDGTNWLPLGAGITGGGISAMIEFNGEYYVGGLFDSADGQIVSKNIALWDGFQWKSVGGGLDGGAGFEIWNNELYASGGFNYEIGVNLPLNGFAKWNGNRWLPVSASYLLWTGPGNLKLYNNELYAGGSFEALFDNGLKTLMYIAKLGCDGLKADFSQNKDTVDLSSSGYVQFTDQTGNAFEWHWNFGDGTTDTVQNPLHSFGDTGIYKITLTTSDGNCNSTAISTIVVKWDCPYLEVDFFQNEDTILITNPIDIEFISQIMYADSINFVDSLRWDFGDGTNDTIQNPVHSYIQLGIYTVTLTAYKDTCSNTAVSTVIVINPTGVKELPALNDNLQIYPNPNTGWFTLKIDIQKNTNLSIKLYQITGQLVFNEDISNANGIYSQQIDLSKYAKGIYYLQVVTDSEVLIKKVIYQ